jgi:hypothetical protein
VNLGWVEHLLQWIPVLKIKYSKHARFQMQERSISESEVEACLDERSICYADKKGNSIIKTAVKGRGIKVVVAQDNPNFVITVADY